ncbi:PREDICTED: exocyst complex component 3-like protein 2 [Haliaeetus leucocephalus]|uniref:exocyst complex component 3-like protein 2 n=1 Tax=Haliaeetus leucocephalus TaxID=52644 RepID=UPI00053CEC77|nr:PREDICTED: exocyst complex component 3-like protein 2 [Haliaeetus leucocephalus]
MPLLKKTPKEEEEDGDPFAANPESRYRRRATLERLVGLAPFGRARRPPPKDEDGDGGRARRRSEDFGLLRRLPGRRKASVEALAERPVPKRSSLLRLALGTRGRRGSVGERPPTVESEEVSDGDQDGGGQRQEGEVLGHPEVGALLQAQALGPLLPPETQRSLESSCIAAVKAKVEVAVAQELQLSEDTWAEEASSEELQEGLATRVTGLLRAHVDRAPQITPEFGMEMAHSLLGVLVAFLHSFQRKVERFLEAPGEATPPDGATGRAIALVNCCPPFRTFAERLAQFGHPESEEPRRQAHAALDKVTRLCNHVLTQRLFEDLKPYFNKLMKRKWLTSSDAFDTIVMLITSFTQKLRPLRPEPYQVLVSEVHRRVLIEYVRPLLQVRLVCTSAKMRARVAARLGDEARQLRELFSRLDSASPWLDSVVPRLRELLVLEDTAALQMEVGVLVRDFPDVRRKHVAAVLDVRGLRSQAARQEILGVVQDLEQNETEPGLPRQRAFFSELTVAREVRCLPFHLPRLARLSRLRLRRPHPQRPGQARL